ncbi:MAG: hypothetical protein M3Z33_11760 [Actinomycetota bacterium]|nr:hypothetical protein [Actinomycetota bacterium]
MKLRSRMIDADACDDEASLVGGEPVVAQLTGGPLDGEQRMLFRLRPTFVVAVPRGRTRRLLGLHRRRIAYRLIDSWQGEDMRHASYEYAEDA